MRQISSDDNFVGSIPRTIDDPPMILWWDIYTVLPVLCVFIFAILSKKFLIPMGCLVAYLFLYKQIKRRIPRGFLVNMLYGIGIASLKGYPLSVQKYYWE